jgi:hypothetical protein
VRLLRFARRLLALDCRRDGRLLVATAVACYFGAVLVADLVADFDLWRYLGVLHISGPFEDMRVITAGWECTRKGFDVLAQNPCDPFQREMNYPRVWTAPAAFGLGQAATVPLTLAVWVLFYGALFVLIGRLTTGEALIYTAILLSPSVMLGVASGNNDLVVFVLLVLGLLMLRAPRPLGRLVSWGVFLFAAIVKLYPVFAFAALVRQRRARVAAVALAVALVPFAAYAAATVDDLRLISRATPRPMLIAYGAGVFLDGVAERLDALGAGDLIRDGLGRVVAYVLCVAAALAAAVWLARRLRTSDACPPGATTTALDAFWVGAAIYLGTFIVLGYNWDYRLVFLLLTIPQLLVWVRAQGSLATAAAVALVVVIATMWLSRLPFVFPFDDLVNWLLCVFFCAALLATLPAWLARPAGGLTFRSRASEATRH